jgi:hypothetical protein
MVSNWRLNRSTTVCRLSALTDASSPRHSNLAVDPLLFLEIDAHADGGGAFFEDVLTPLLATRMELPYACNPMLKHVLKQPLEFSLLLC